MAPMAGFFGLGPTELVIILVILLVLFGGSRLAGLGKSSGRAIREFKEETKNLLGEPSSSDDEVIEAELVEPRPQQIQTQQAQTQQTPAQQPMNSTATNSSGHEA